MGKYLDKAGFTRFTNGLKTKLDAKANANNVYTKSEIDTKENAINADIDAIEEKIPTQASANNQLADKDFVNSSINSIVAFYITRTANGDAFESVSQLNDTTTFYSGGEIRVPTRNDYCIVRVDENHDNATTRYIYQNNQWEYQYTVNETALTAAQLAAINSGITALLVTDFRNHLSDTSNPHNVTKAQIGLGNVDNTSDLDKPISSATQNALNTLDTNIQDKQNKITPSNKLASDLVDDSNQNNKFVTRAEKTTWNNKYTVPSTGIPASDLEEAYLPLSGGTLAGNVNPATDNAYSLGFAGSSFLGFAYVCSHRFISRHNDIHTGGSGQTTYDCNIYYNDSNTNNDFHITSTNNIEFRTYYSKSNSAFFTFPLKNGNTTYTIATTDDLPDLSSYDGSIRVNRVGTLGYTIIEGGSIYISDIYSDVYIEIKPNTITHKSLAGNTYSATLPDKNGYLAMTDDCHASALVRMTQVTTNSQGVVTNVGSGATTITHVFSAIATISGTQYQAQINRVGSNYVVFIFNQWDGTNYSWQPWAGTMDELTFVQYK